MLVRWVRQEDHCGCVVASLAMVTGRSYAEVRAWFSGSDFERHGITYDDAMAYLGDHGIPCVRRFRWLPGHASVGAQRPRPDWPAPFAPVHLVAVNGSRHVVVLLEHGQTVLDPMLEQPRRFADVGDVSYMLGVWPDVRLVLRGGA